MEVSIQQAQLMLSRIASVLNMCVPLQVARDGHAKVFHFFNTGNWGRVNRKGNMRLDKFSGDNQERTL